MQRFIRLLFCLLPLLLSSEELEVALKTKSLLPNTYLSRINTDNAETDWRYFEELRTILEFDLNKGGATTVTPLTEPLEETLKFPNIVQKFKAAPYKQENIPFVVGLQIIHSKLHVTAFQVEKERFKEYPPIPLTGKVEEDRKQIHRLADFLYRDLYQKQGIASLKILYSKREKNFSPKEDLQYLSEIYLCDSDGGNNQRLTHQNGYCMSPGIFVASQNDFSFYYVFFHEGQTKIYRSSMSTPHTEPLIHLRGNQALPSFSKRGHLMAFIGDAAGRPDLFLQAFDAKGNLKGRARQIFSAPRATQASPTFSPDGKKIAFVSDKDGAPRIYLMDVPEAKSTRLKRPHLLTQKNRENSCPAWSPDGKKIAYSAKIEGIRQIWLYDLLTQEETQLTTGPYAKENPSWAPDNLHLIYNTESDEYAELYLLHIEQQKPQLISKGPGLKRFACFIDPTPK